MTRPSEPTDQARIDAFIGEPAHAGARSAVDQLLVSQIIGCKRLRCADIA